MTPTRRRALIAFKTRMAERWATDREAMLKRSRAGGMARTRKAATVRNSVQDWLATKGTWHTKEQLMLMLEKHDRRRTPENWFRLIVACGFITFDDEQGKWLNRCQRI